MKMETQKSLLLNILFKAKRFEIVDNSKYGDSTPIDLVSKEIRKFMKQPVSNPIGKQWMADQKLNRNNG